MQRRDQDILEHIISYCDRIAGYIDKLGNNKEAFLGDTKDLNVLSGLLE